MKFTSVVRRSLALVMLGSLALLFAIPGPSAAARHRHRRDPQTVTITPSTPLFVSSTIQQVVNVSWSGFPPGANDGSATGQVLLLQCNANPTKYADCADPAFRQTVAPTSSNGTGSALYTVDNAAGKANCDHDHPCSIAVFTEEGNFHTAILAPLPFAVTPDNCPPLDGGQLTAHGAGDAAAFRAMLGWETAECSAPALTAVQYSQSMSDPGKEDFIGGIQDYAITTVPFTPDQEAALTKKGKTYKYAPLTASGLVFAYQVFTHHGASVLGNQVTDLKLTPKIITKIFITGDIKNWNDPEILDLNPQYKNGNGPPVLPTHIQRSGPAVSSGATLQLTSWLDETERDLYRGAGGLFANGATDQLSPQPLDWMSSTPDKIDLAVANPGNPDFVQNGFIGFMDASEAAQYGLPTAKIENASGNFVAPNQNSLAAALAAGTIRPDGTFVPDYTPDDPNAYPLPMITDLVAGTNDKSIDPHAGAVLAKFLTYAVGDGQNNLPAGYVPLPTALSDVTQGVIDQIPNDPTTPSKTPSQTPSGSTTTPVDIPSYSSSPYVAPSLDISPVAVASVPGSILDASSPCPVVTQAPVTSLSSASATPTGGTTSSSPSTSPGGSGGSKSAAGGGGGSKAGYPDSVLAANGYPSPSASPSPAKSKSASTTPHPTPTPSSTPAATTSPSPVAGCLAAASGSGLIPSGAARLVLPALVILGAIGLVGPLSRREGGVAAPGLADAKDRLRDLRERW